MKRAPLPENETARLAALRRARILDTLPELPFDDFVKIAARIAGTPMALVSLIDEERQWFKAKHGLELSETPREWAFCAYAILEEDLFVVADAHLDDRFAENPLVVGPPNIRFYAGAPLHDEDGHALGTLCVLDRVARELDEESLVALRALSRLVSSHIALRRRALEATELHQETLAQTARLRTKSELLDLANDMILVKDRDHRITFWNRGCERTYGWPRLEALGRIAHELLQTSFAEPLAQIDEKLRTQGHWEGYLEQTRRDGTKLTVESRWVVQRGPDGEISAILALNQDVTKRHEVQRLKDEFVSVVSHELRTPLTSIRGALGLLEGGVVGDLGAEATDLVRIARTNADRLIRLVNEILDLEKMEAGKLELQRKDLTISTLFDTVRAAISDFAREHSVTLAADVPAELKLVADEDRIVQLLTNLASNAIKFSPPNTEVVLRAVRRGPRSIRLSVRDQGPGIAQELLPKLFQKFQQLDSSDRRQRGGTGLGLAISKAIAEAHGGTIGVDTTQGAGATFWVDLPVVAISSQRTIGHGARRLVLLVDPAGNLARMLGRLLADEQCVVARAADLVEAERWLDNSQPAAILIDVDLPAGTALELVTRLSSRYAPGNAPTIILTGRGEPDELPSIPLPIEWVSDPLDESRMKHALRWGRRDQRRAKVLLVEDDAGMRTVLAARLQQLGVDCIQVADGESAVTAVRAHAPDLIVLDVGLPGRDGFDVVDELRRDRARSTPLIVYTARELDSDDRAGLTLGLTRWLTKARTTESDLVATVRELLNGLLPT